MRAGWLVALVLVIAAIMLSLVGGQAEARETEDKQEENCSLEKGWEPAEDLPRILAEHQEWVERWKDNGYSDQWADNHPEGRANLCNADLTGTAFWGTNLIGAVLFRTNLTRAILLEANLSKARLIGANLSKANLTQARLIQADLRGADLTLGDLRGANLTKANLTGVVLTEANLSKANLHVADLSKANLTGVDLTRANLTQANLTQASLGDEATLSNADLREADLRGAKLTGADLRGVDLAKANLSGADLSGTRLAFTVLTGTIYAPASPPPDPYLEGINGLSTVSFPEDSGSGLVQLRDLLQKSGLRDLEREATFAIERGKTWHLLKPFHHWLLKPFHHWMSNYSGDDNLQQARDHLQQVLDGVPCFDIVCLVKLVLKHPSEVGEGLFRLVFFDLTTAYGLYPANALLIIFWIGVLLIPVYVWTIFRTPHWLNGPGIYRVWSKERIEASAGWLRLSDANDIERLNKRDWHAITWAAYFSLLSAFHIGWRDLSIGTWITRAQPREYTLKPTGWVRFVSGLQSLLSVYLLAIWALTYFGRPFQ